MDVIDVKNLVKYYGKVKALDDVSFSIKKGSICGILGPNGSGKTTTIKSICNLIIPNSGSVKLLGKTNKKGSKYISALFEGTRNLYWRLTPTENLRYFAGIRGLGGKNIETKIEELLERFNLLDKKRETVNNLSRGMQQKVAIAMTLICDTEIILLDEPTLGLDIQSFMDIKGLLKGIARDMNKTILISTHDMNLVEDICTDVVVLNKGKVVADDSIENLLNKYKRFTYQISLAESISNEDKDYLKNQEEFYFTDDDSKLEIDIFHLDEIYSIIKKIKDRNILIKEIRQKDINFERVYLNLTNGEEK